MGHIKKLALGASAAVLLLTGCGGGGSSSGAAQYNGVYLGAADVTYSYRGRSETRRIRTRITVTGKTVTVTDNGQRFGRGERNGNRYSVPWKFESVSDSGTKCDWSLVYRGELLSALTRGIISGSASCSNDVVFSVSGSYEVTKQATTSREGSDVENWGETTF